MMPKLYTVYGFTGTINELGEHFSINPRTLATRLRAGWSLEMAVSTPVDKSKSIKTGMVLEIGKVRGLPDFMEKRFGVVLDGKMRRSSDRSKRHIQTYVDPKFYDIGDGYRGSLKAISVDFKCPMSALVNGVKDGKTPIDILKENGCLAAVEG